MTSEESQQVPTPFPLRPASGKEVVIPWINTLKAVRAYIALNTFALLDTQAEDGGPKAVRILP
jgi:hypothetical protein